VNAYPDTVHYQGLNRPRHIEANAWDLEVEGAIPPEIDGAFFRAVPDPRWVPRRKDDVILSADGAINKIEFRDGRVNYALRYVRTARFVAEEQAGRSLFGAYRNPYTNDPIVAGVDGTVANTTPIWHAGRLFMTKEDGLPYQIDPDTLATIGKWDFDGALRSETVTAHARVDPATGELFFFGYEADGLASRKVAYGIADASGKLVREQWFDAPYCAFMHDFALTAEHAIFLAFPTTADLDRLKAGGPHWIHEQDRESWIGIMPRYGSVDELRWVQGPVGVHAYHVMNAFTQGTQVVVDMCLANTNLIPFIVEDSGLDIQLTGGLTRWTIDLAAATPTVDEHVLGPFGEMPRATEADMGRAYRRGWYLSIDPEGGKPLHNGPAGLAFNLLLRVDLGNGTFEAMPLGQDRAINEVVHIPADDPTHGGWLMAMVDRELIPDHYDQEIWIIEADEVAKGPIAKVKMPVVTREQVHGNWVPRAVLDTAVTRSETVA